MDFSVQGEDAAPFVIAAMTLFWLLVALVHCAFAVGVFADASNRRRLWFVSVWIWALATLMGGAFVAGVYWIIHHSMLNPAQANARANAERDADVT